MYNPSHLCYVFFLIIANRATIRVSDTSLHSFQTTIVIILYPPG